MTLERARSMMVAAVYGDGTPPRGFTERLDDVIAAARSEQDRDSGLTEPNWKALYEDAAYLVGNQDTALYSVIAKHRDAFRAARSEQDRDSADPAPAGLDVEYANHVAGVHNAWCKCGDNRRPARLQSATPEAAGEEGLDVREVADATRRFRERFDAGR